ncbi:FAD-dependent monooxygenase [Amycolatopsis anabasis]|uniref:FAD-dependent monooxygenase n=1 Tax=Amycolatopsis anabasis TaxID=1840409 RepID=UPI001C556514|nr:FAD-dependent monooxygenase [Amycolatopsis anabasis]
MTEAHRTGVLIVGGGPVGMLLAGELGLHGVRTTLIETLTETHDEPRAGTLHARTAQSLLRRGYLAEPAPGERDPDETVLVPFHFGGMSALTIEAPAIEGPPIVGQSQAAVERFLEARARDRGVDIRRGHEGVALRADADAARVTVRHGDDEYPIRADYVVGCDGARSMVRREAGIPSTSHPATFAGILGLVRLLDPASCPNGWVHTDQGWMLINVNPLGQSRLLTHDFTHPLPGRDAPLDLAELQETTARIVGREVPMDQPGFLGRFSDFCRIADRYRAGRVLLAGDAAHVHSPLGGQGLNLGLQDAFNLGWKLAMVATGSAPDSLLDTYHTERHPVGERVIANTRAQAALMRPGPEQDPLRDLVRDLLSFDEPNRYVADLISGQSVAYRPAAPGSSTLDGHFLPNVPLETTEGPRTVAGLLHAARPVLLVNGDGDLAEAARKWQDRVDVVRLRTSEPLGAAATLCRPDGYVAFTAATRSGLEDGLTTWFGPA